MFKFLSDVGEAEVETTISKTNKNSNLRLCEEISIRQEHYELATQTPHSVTPTSPSLKYIKVAQLLNSTQASREPTLRNILGSSSDLIPGQYEGGFKLWESTFDLLLYLEDNVEIVGIGPTTKVLDLGCGHGLLGLYALAKGANQVVFQDYNSEVLNFLTIPNVVINKFDFDGGTRKGRIRFFGGGWNSMNEFVQERDEDGEFKFDLILSSETIYNMEYIDDFMSLVDSCLTMKGSLYLAAKTFYFGVGGGTKSFTALVKNNPGFEISTVKVIQNGVQREVLRVYRKRDTLL